MTSAGLFLKNEMDFPLRFPSRIQFEIRMIWERLIRNLDKGRPVTSRISEKI
jgi:hypothetical protein